MTDELDVELYGYRVGRLIRAGVEEYELLYDAEWASSDVAVPLSLSLPLRNQRHRGRVVASFLDNLLPDSPDVRQRWATDARLDTTEPFFLLREYGEDVAGAVSFRPANVPSRTSRTPVDDDQIAERIRRLRADATAWHDDGQPTAGQFSLGGAQRKFSLARDNAGWSETTGTEPSTHLFKPQVDGLPDGELVEYLVMRTAQYLGIATAEVDIFDHGDEHSLIVTRFDRRVEHGRAIRLHQEDLLQSLGVPRLLKYEANGGPGIDAISRLLKKEADRQSLERYAVSLMFAWVVLSTDAHAKNNSVFLQAEGATLTPLYDAVSLIPYLAPDSRIDVPSLLSRAADLRLSVNYGATARAGDVGLFELDRIAQRCGMPADRLLALTATYLYEISGVMEDVASRMPSRLQTATIARAVEWMPIRARQAAEALGVSGLFA
jgi:serine/threonine-protein kinase HipA